MLAREKCAEWFKEYNYLRTNEDLQAFANRAYQEGQKDMQARAYHAVPFSHMKCADTIKAEEMK